MKKLLLVIICYAAFGSLFAQEEQTKEAKSNEIGMHMGATTGMGLSYRHWFHKVGFQLTALPVKADKTMFYSAGITALYSFIETKHVRAFGYLGNHYMYSESKDEFGITSSSRQYNIGFGPGFAFGTVVTFNIMVGYGLYDVTDKFNMFPTGEIGVYFHF
jgi:hypothetical protein